MNGFDSSYNGGPFYFCYKGGHVGGVFFKRPPLEGRPWVKCSTQAASIKHSRINRAAIKVGGAFSPIPFTSDLSPIARETFSPYRTNPVLRCASCYITRVFGYDRLRTTTDFGKLNGPARVKDGHYR